MTIERIESEEMFQWIRDGTARFRLTEDADFTGNFVSDCIPPVYAAYCKLFHPIYTNASVSATAGSWAAADVYPTKIFFGRLVSISTNYGAHGRRVRWQELADKFGLQFHPEFNKQSLTHVFPDQSWPRSLLGPDEGDLDIFTCQRLVNYLEPYTNGQLCFFHYDLIATPELEADKVFSGELDDVLDICNEQVVWGTPTHWWSQDRAWLVCTDWDLEFTLIAGSCGLITQLINDRELECIKVNPKTRIDWYSDQINVGNDK